MAASLRSLKRSRVTYDDTDPAGSGALVSAALGMFASSEHRGLYSDACSLAEIILWGKGDRYTDSRYALVSGGEVTELISNGNNEWSTTDLTTTFKFNGENSTLNQVIEALSLATKSGPTGTNPDDFRSFWSFKFNADGEEPVYVVEIPPPVALTHLKTWYVFDAPCVFEQKDQGMCTGLRCSALGHQSPVLHVVTIEPSLGNTLSVLNFNADDFTAEICKALMRSMDNVKTKVQLFEHRSGGGRAFVRSWEAEERRSPGAAITMKVLWGAVAADFWDRTLNTSEPWSSSKLGSYHRGEGVDGSLMEMGASMLEHVGLGLVDEEFDDDGEDDSNYELVALSSLRFMRDASVTYPTTIVTFDAGSSGWALEMFDSVAINALELAYYLLTDHFQL